MNKHNTEIDDNRWGEFIGFEASPNVVPKVKENNYFKARKYDNHSFNKPNGEALPKFPVPVCGNMRDNTPSDTPSPEHAMINFNFFVR